MQVKYDKTADAKYYKLGNTKVFKTTQEKEWLFFDRNKNNEVIGVEVLNASEHPVGIVSFEGKLLQYHISTETKDPKNKLSISDVSSVKFGQLQSA